jgi:hypothetical protein
VKEISFKDVDKDFSDDEEDSEGEEHKTPEISY